jgi:hypothetical protein
MTSLRDFGNVLLISNRQLETVASQAKWMPGPPSAGTPLSLPRCELVPFKHFFCFSEAPGLCPGHYQ